MTVDKKKQKRMDKSKPRCSLQKENLCLIRVDTACQHLHATDYHNRKIRLFKIITFATGALTPKASPLASRSLDSQEDIIIKETE